MSWIYAASLFDEHPPYGNNAGKATVKPGTQWTVDRVNQIAKSKLWESTVIFITWDDWGGWYDHVDSPLKGTWKGGGPNPAYINSQFTYEPRVGCVVLSPYAKRGYVSKAFHSHVSLVKFCETTFGLKPLDAREAASDDMSDCFDFKQTLPPPSWSDGAPTPVPTPGAKPKLQPKRKRRKPARPAPRKTPKRKTTTGQKRKAPKR